jgi:DNA end-binding protein Ku
VVAILPLEKGMVVHTLHEPRDLYDYHKLFERVADAKPEGEMVKLARQLIERQEGKFQPADTEDHYEKRLRDVIDAKLRGEGIEPEKPATSRGDNVIDLMAALKRSLSQDKPERAKPASAPARRKIAAKRTGGPKTKAAAGRKRA